TLEVAHPFAQLRFRTDGAHLLASFGEELVAADAAGQLAWASPIAERLDQFDYAGEVVWRWWPRGRAGGVAIDRGVAFGWTGAGEALPRARHQLGVEALVHADQCAAGTPDAEWLAAAAERDWIVVTGDRRAERVPAARERLRASGVACFVLAVGRRGRLEQV